MKLLEDWLRLRRQAREDNSAAVKERRAARARSEALRRRLNELREQQITQERALRRLLRQREKLGTAQTEEEKTLLNQIAALREEGKKLHLAWHMEQFHRERSDFRQYYRHINRTRPLVLIVNLALWFCLFWFGGFNTGIKVVLLFFALATTVGSIFELFFMVRLRERIIEPVDNLIKGVSEIAEGNYEVKVEEPVSGEVTKLVRAFNDMAIKLREGEILKAEYEENRKNLIASISHDLKTPITSIQAYAEAIRSDLSLSAEKRETYLKVIHSNAVYMNRLIDDLFLFAKLDLQKLDFHFETADIGPLLEDMAEEFRLELLEQGVAFSLENCLASKTPTRLDAKRFNQALRNLIDNAVKYGPAAGLEIKTKLSMRDGRISLAVSDNGPGIREENLAHIFERFYRAEPERTKDLSSTGLGLAITRELIEAHGGEITAASRLGEGTCFTITLPVSKEVQEL